jgi:hypothetical protein
LKEHRRQLVKKPEPGQLRIPRLTTVRPSNLTQIHERVSDEASVGKTKPGKCRGEEQVNLIFELERRGESKTRDL